jgi:leader peptidase (prepilin peptidase)/N-methyltransferase
MTFFFFLFGLTIGSFANVCIYRWPKNGSVRRPVRSFCPWCRRTLVWYENIPVLSFLFLRGRCRDCKSPISWRYPLVELLMGILWGGVFYLLRPSTSGDWIFFLLQLEIMFVILVSTFIDIDWKIIPDLCTLPLLGFGLAAAVFNPWLGVSPFDRLLQSLVGILIGGGVPWTMSMVARLIAGKDGVGWGDIKLLAAYGAILGWRGAVVVYILGCFLGGVPAAI